MEGDQEGDELKPTDGFISKRDVTVEMALHRQGFPRRENEDNTRLLDHQAGDGCIYELKNE